MLLLPGRGGGGGGGLKRASLSLWLCGDESLLYVHDAPWMLFEDCGTFCRLSRKGGMALASSKRDGVHVLKLYVF